MTEQSVTTNQLPFGIFRLQVGRSRGVAPARSRYADRASGCLVTRCFDGIPARLRYAGRDTWLDRGTLVVPQNCLKSVAVILVLSFVIDAKADDSGV